MSEFLKRLEAPTKDNKYYYSENIFYKSSYGLPNCTCYAWGRWYELLNKKPTLCINNATDWYYYPDGYEREQIPSLGDIACFINNSTKIGHVAVVEEIYENGSILLSNSNYGGSLFYTLKLDKPYNLGGGYKFLGFIKFPISFNNNTNTSTKVYQDYLITSGDTLTSIAKQFGTTYQELARINNISNSDLIYAGSIIKVPKIEKSNDYVEYVVNSGDTLSSIAKQFGTTYQELARINNISNPDLIYKGQVIKIY